MTEESKPKKPVDRRVFTYSPHLSSFHCFCGEQHQSATEMTHCKCGRSWVRGRED